MASKRVTRSAGDWQIFRTQVGASPAASTQEQELRQFRLYERLSQIAKAAEGPSHSVEMRGWERKLGAIMVENVPSSGWTVQGLPVKWRIQQALGLVIPEWEDPDEDDE